MPGIILDESEDEEGEVSGDVNTLQARDMFFFSERKPGQQKRDCWAYQDWKKKKPNLKTGNMSRKPISCFNCVKEGHISGDW